MRFEIQLYGIDIIPETPQDLAYLRDTLGVTPIDAGSVAWPPVTRDAVVTVTKVVGIREVAHITIRRAALAGKGGEKKPAPPNFCERSTSRRLPG